MGIPVPSEEKLRPPPVLPALLPGKSRPKPKEERGGNPAGALLMQRALVQHREVAATSVGPAEEQESCHQHGQLPQALITLEKVLKVQEVPALPSSSPGGWRSLIPASQDRF